MTHEAFMREHYAKRGVAFCAQSLGISLRRVQRLQQALGLYRKERWTLADDAELRMLWPELMLSTIAKRLGRTKAATYQRAKVIGLELGCPQGWEYLTAAGARVGFNVTQLRKILAWADVPLRRAQARPGTTKRATRRMWIVEPELVDDAVESWLATEPLFCAEKRTGVSSKTLQRLLEADPRVGPKPDGKAHWRVPSAVVDALVARWLSQETIAQAAQRLGVRYAALRGRLIAVGIHTPDPGRKGLRFPVEVIDHAWRTR